MSLEYSFGQYVKALRERVRLDRATAAKELGVTMEEIREWETGQNLPNKELIEKISLVYQLSAHELPEILEIEVAMRRAKTQK